MSVIAEAACEISDRLTERHIDHFFVGGLAAQHWGVPQMTARLEVCVIAPHNEWPGIVQNLLEDFPERTGHAAELANTMWTLPVYARAGVPLDVSLAMPAFREETAATIKHVELAPDKMVPICCAEDLVVYKMVVRLPCDFEEVEGIIMRQGKRLNADLVRKRLEALSDVLGDRAALAGFEEAWNAMVAGDEE